MPTRFTVVGMLATGTTLGTVTDWFGRTAFETKAPAAGVVLYLCSVPSISKGGTIASVAVVRADDPR